MCPPSVSGAIQSGVPLTVGLPWSSRRDGGGGEVDDDNDGIPVAAELDGGEKDAEGGGLEAGGATGVDATTSLSPTWI
jgi:hypothetical protein